MSWVSGCSVTAPGATPSPRTLTPLSREMNANRWAIRPAPGRWWGVPVSTPAPCAPTPGPKAHVAQALPHQGPKLLHLPHPHLCRVGEGGPGEGSRGVEQQQSAVEGVLVDGSLLIAKCIQADFPHKQDHIEKGAASTSFNGRWGSPHSFLITCTNLDSK